MTLTFDEIIEACQQNPRLVDAAVRSYYEFDISLSTWQSLSTYPHLGNKIQTQKPGEPPDFTLDDLQERDTLIQQLLEAAKVIHTYFQREMICEREDKPFQIPHPIDKFNDFHNGLYLLARWGDESAFLELTAKHSRFCQNWVFQQSLEYWKNKVMNEDDKRAGAILKKLQKAIVTPCKLPQPGRLPQRTPGIDDWKETYQGFLSIKASKPETPNSEIHRQLAVKKLKEKEKPIDPDSIKKEAARIKKELQNTSKTTMLPNPVLLTEYMQTKNPDINKKMLNDLQNVHWQMIFPFLKKKYYPK